MNSPVDRSLRRRMTPAALHVTLHATLCGLLMFCVGCIGNWSRPRFPFQRQPEVCVFPEGVSKDVLIDYLNRNQNSVHAWRCTEATLKIAGPGGVPVTLTANLAVERPRNIRLRAKSIRGDEADLGSNDDRFWFWVRDAQDRILTASHEDAQLVRDHLQLPFEPEWLMETLGVGYIDPALYSMQHHGPGTHRATLVSTQTTPNGQTLHREIVVDTCRGEIREHGISDRNHQPIARAILSDYRTAGSVALPHSVELIWSRSGQRMRVRLRNVEVNPQTNLAKMWVFPEIDGAQAVDIGDQIRQRQQTMGTTQLQRGPRYGESPGSGSAAQPGTAPQTATSATRWEQPVIREVSDPRSASGTTRGFVERPVPPSALEEPVLKEPVFEEPDWAPDLPPADGQVGRARLEPTGFGPSGPPRTGAMPWSQPDSTTPGTAQSTPGVVRIRSLGPLPPELAEPAEPPWAGTAP